MEVLTPTREDNPALSISDLWIELRIACGYAPGRSQFYEWLKAAWIHGNSCRGGVKQKQTYTDGDLNRLKRLHELKAELGSLKAAQEALKADIANNPQLYGA